MDRVPSEARSDTLESLYLTPPAEPNPTGLLKAVYKDVWDEFYNWSAQDSRQHIHDIFDRRSVIRTTPKDRRKRAQLTPQGSSASRASKLYRWKVSSGDGGSRPVSTPREVIDVDLSGTSPHQPYTSCTPSSQIIAYRENDYDDGDGIPFIPFADDPSFDMDRYVRSAIQYSSLAWQDLAKRDPDVEMIQLETMRRLHFRHGITLEDIDSTGLLTVSRASNESGLIWNVSQRDQLFWSGPLPASEMPVLKGDFQPRANDLAGRINSVLVTFCPVSLCLNAYCPTHTRSQPTIDNQYAQLDDDTLRKNGKSCGELCFLSAEEDFKPDPASWDDYLANREDCLAILSIIPDGMPCDLATLCRMPCREIHRFRCSKIIEEGLAPLQKSRAHYRKLTPQPEFADVVDAEPTLIIPRVQPCHHHGPCDGPDSGCECFAKRLHCSKHCRCNKSCILRWDGCKCPNGKKCDENCLCLKNRRECDPDECKCRGSRKYDCLNCGIQRGMPAKLEVKPGLFGLGAFAMDRIKKGSYIGEYIGELFPDNSDRHSTVRDHSHLNYLFGLGPDVLDAHFVGNETRYINHANPGSRRRPPNVDALRLSLVFVMFHTFLTLSSLL